MGLEWHEPYPIYSFERCVAPYIGTAAYIGNGIAYPATYKAMQDIWEWAATGELDNWVADWTMEDE